jgi:ADP-ribose pyrophosphatase YjhB (NUDIX family)
VSGGLAVRPLDRAPEVVPVAPPDLGAAEHAQVDAERLCLDAHPTLSDGAILMVTAASPERLAVYPATYAWHTADRVWALPGTQGALGVQLALVGDGGAILWQRRSDTVDHPGGWTISVAGCAVPDVDLERQIVDEAGEELGVGRDDLLDLGLLALVEDPRGRTVQVVFRARLRPGARVIPHPSEVAEVRFAKAFPEDGAAESLTAAWWSDMVRLATGYG